MADKDDKARDPKTGKFLGKYDSMEDAEKGHTELEKKFGEQGASLGTLKKHMEQYQKDLQTYQAWANEARPIIEWYSKFQQPISQWWNQFQGAQGNGNGQGQQYGQQGMTQQQGQQAWNQAANMVNQTQGAELLTPQEKQALIQQTAQSLVQQTLVPWTNDFAKRVEAWGQSQSKSITEQLDQRFKTFSDLMWKTQERMIPADKLAEAKAWHAEALKFTDPKNLNPLEMASETLSLRNEKSRMEQEIKELRAANEKREKDALGSLGNDGGGLFRKTSDIKEMPKNRDERLANVIGSVKEQSGVEGLREVFPSL